MSTEATTLQINSGSNQSEEDDVVGNINQHKDFKNREAKTADQFQFQNQQHLEFEESE